MAMSVEERDAAGLKAQDQIMSRNYWEQSGGKSKPKEAGAIPRYAESRYRTEGLRFA